MPNDNDYTVDEHFLPRMYLKEFSEIKKKGNKEKAFVWQYNVRTMIQTPIQVNVQDICFEKNLYELRMQMALLLHVMQSRKHSVR